MAIFNHQIHRPVRRSETPEDLRQVFYVLASRNHPFLIFQQLEVLQACFSMRVDIEAAGLQADSIISRKTNVVESFP